MLRPLRWVLALLLASTFGGVAAAQTPEEIFDRGNRAYEEGRFEEAAEAYRTVLRYGVRDSRAEYNLANAEFKLGHLGRAVLHYRRALRLDPTDEDTRSNLALVESHLVDRVEVQEPAAPIRWAIGLQERIGPDRQAVAALALFWLAAGLIAWCSARPGGWNAGAGWMLAVLLVLVAGTTLSWRVSLARLEGRELAVVLEDSVEVLAGPGGNNATLFTIHEGTTLEIRAQRGEWLQAGLPNGLNGWLRREAVERV